MAKGCAVAPGLALGQSPFTQPLSQRVQATGPLGTAGLAPSSYM